MSIGPCAYPGCRDLDGNPELTRDTICEQSRFHYRRTLDRLVEHWVLLRTTMPVPVSTGMRVVVKSGEKIFGHPREWSSDMAAAVTRQFHDSHVSLVDHLGHNVRVPTHKVAEMPRMKAAYPYLTNWFDRLCTYPYAAQDAAEFHNLNRQILAGLGHTYRQERVEVPCPECDMLTLVRTVTEADERTVECQSCGLRPSSAEYTAWLIARTEEIFDVFDPAA